MYLKQNSISIIPPGDLIPGGDYTLSTKIYNIGNRSAGFEARYYYQKMSEENLINGISVQELVPGGEYIFTADWSAINFDFDPDTSFKLIAVVGAASP